MVSAHQAWTSIRFCLTSRASLERKKRMSFLSSNRGRRARPRFITWCHDPGSSSLECRAMWERLVLARGVAGFVGNLPGGDGALVDGSEEMYGRSEPHTLPPHRKPGWLRLRRTDRVCGGGIVCGTFLPSAQRGEMPFPWRGGERCLPFGLWGVTFSFWRGGE